MEADHGRGKQVTVHDAALKEGREGGKEGVGEERERDGGREGERK